MRKKARIIWVIAAILVLALVAGCGGVGQSSNDGMMTGSSPDWDSGRGFEPVAEGEFVLDEKVAEAPAEASAYGERDVAYAAERLIIRIGNISMVVEDTRATQETIEAMVEEMASEGAFVVSAREYGGREEEQPYITISIRVPAIRFGETMNRLEQLAVKLTGLDESAQDVTEEYVDLESRLESLEAARERLLGIMEEARNTEDLLQAEQQLTQREAEIESIKGRMQYLEQSAMLSIITIELQPYILNQPVSDEWNPDETARSAEMVLMDSLRGFGDFAIFFSIAVLPWLVALGLVILVIALPIRWRARVRRARKAAKEAASD